MGKRHPVMTQEALVTSLKFCSSLPTTKSVTDGWATWNNFLPYSTLPMRSVYVTSRHSEELLPSQDNYMITFPCEWLLTCCVTKWILNFSSHKHFFVQCRKIPFRWIKLKLSLWVTESYFMVLNDVLNYTNM